MSARGPAPTAQDLVARLAAEGLSAGTWSNGPGDRYAVHEHGYDKVLVAAAGSITFLLATSGDPVLLEPGDRLDLPAGTPHGALVGSAGVSCLEAHLVAGSLDAGVVHHPGWGLPGGPGSRAETGRGRTA